MSAQLFKNRQNNFRRQLENEIHTKSSDTIISGEGMSVKLGSSGIRALLDFLQPHYTEIKVIIYVRPLYSYAVSMFQQAVREGNKANLTLANPNYSKRYAPWIESFGAENVIFAKYDYSVLTNGDVVEDLFGRLGLDFSRTVKTVSNVSISAEAVAILYCNNKINGSLTGSKPARRAHARLVDLLGSVGSAKFSFSTEMFQDLKAKSAKNRAWLQNVTGLVLDEAPVPEKIIFGSEEDILKLAGEQNEVLRSLFPDLSSGAAEDPAHLQCASMIGALQNRLLKEEEAAFTAKKTKIRRLWRLIRKLIRKLSV